MLQKEWTVIKYVAPDKPLWNLTNNKLYAVVTDTEDYGLVEEDDTWLTVWNDEGHLAEVYDGEYEIVTIDEKDWFKARPNQIYMEIM